MDIKGIFGGLIKTIGQVTKIGVLEDAGKALQGSDIPPEQVAVIEKQVQEFTLLMYSKEIEDRASARAREIAVKDNTPKVLAYGYGLMFLITLAGFIFLAVYNIKVDPAIKTSIDILLGAEIGMVLGSKEYYFGSSSGSRAKDDVINKLSE